MNSLENWNSKLSALRENIQKYESTGDEGSVIYRLAQVRMYDNLYVLTDADLARGIGISRQKLKNILKGLKDKNPIV
ncbi:hypothetical protein AALA52_05325 [Lactococcus ileimucosae]|uniref:Uncharacterized protein n=1 Tax=Lactococcus ileimucosae TaxID=2941329 RepID=A0ABV4D284_9LACT